MTPRTGLGTGLVEVPEREEDRPHFSIILLLSACGSAAFMVAKVAREEPSGEWLIATVILLVGGFILAEMELGRGGTRV